VYFDRAFEAVPDLDWDMTIIDGWDVPPAATVGIANWIIDEFGAYIGCRIWIKIPCDGCPPLVDDCEVLALVGDVLPDPGFESVGGGPSGTEIPNVGEFGFGRQLQYSDGSLPDDQKGIWFTSQDFSSNPSPGWAISTVHPRPGGGTRHLRSQWIEDNFPSLPWVGYEDSPPILIAGGQLFCGIPYPQGAAVEAQWLLTRIETGQVLTVDSYVSLSVASDTVHFWQGFDIFDEAGDYQQTPDPWSYSDPIVLPVSSDYTLHTYSYVVPAGGPTADGNVVSEWAFTRPVWVFNVAPGTGNFVVDIIDCKVEIA
jgi:hypothetical protein